MVATAERLVPIDSVTDELTHVANFYEEEITRLNQVITDQSREIGVLTAERNSVRHSYDQVVKDRDGLKIAARELRCLEEWRQQLADDMAREVTLAPVDDAAAGFHSWEAEPSELYYVTDADDWIPRTLTAVVDVHGDQVKLKFTCIALDVYRVEVVL